MRRYRSSPLFFAFAGMFLVFVADGKSGEFQPFRATIDATEALTATQKPGISTVQIKGTGLGALFGKLTFSATETIDFGSEPGTAAVTDGKFIITAANGDQLFATYSGSGVPDKDNPGLFLGSAIATLTGGTGRFVCASGTVPFSILIDAAALREVITFNDEAQLVGSNCHKD